MTVGKLASMKKKKKKTAWDNSQLDVKLCSLHKEHDTCMASGSTYTAGKLTPRAEVQLWALCSYEIPIQCSLVYSRIIATFPFTHWIYTRLL